jgi:hypothetical protein
VDVNGTFVAEADLPAEMKKRRKKRARDAEKAAKKPGKEEKKPPTQAQGKAGEGKKRKKANFSKGNAKKWVYVTNLPLDCTAEELARHFGKAGVLELDVSTHLPRVKLYRDAGSGLLKGDASVCFANVESVAIARAVLDQSVLRPDGLNVIGVSPASFEQKGGALEEREAPSLQQRKVAKLAAAQATSWDAGENGRLTGGVKGLTIVVLKRLFDLGELGGGREDDVLKEVEGEIVKICGELGSIEKITVFSRHPDGVAIVKFKEVDAANECIRIVAGLEGFRGRKGKAGAHFWDGATDYTNRDAKKEEKEEEERLDQFGDWLENQEVPEEFRVREE